MPRIAFGGFQHETNTFAPSKARFEDGAGLMATLRDGSAACLPPAALEPIHCISCS